MRVTGVFLFALLIAGSCYQNAFSEAQGKGTGAPLRYLSSCEIDLNGDDETDIAFLVETIRGRELIMLLHRPNGYEAFMFKAIGERAQLECRFGKTVRETEASPHSGKEHKTPGAYIEIIYPEASSVAYVWTNGKFSEIWTSD